jgi:hypothetical protein
VLPVITGVIKLRVVPSKLVHAESENQSTTEPAIVPAVNKTVPVPQRLLGVVEIIAPEGLIVANTAVRVLLTQPVKVSREAA